MGPDCGSWLRLGSMLRRATAAYVAISTDKTVVWIVLWLVCTLRVTAGGPHQEVRPLSLCRAIEEHVSVPRGCGRRPAGGGGWHLRWRGIRGGLGGGGRGGECESLFFSAGRTGGYILDNSLHGGAPIPKRESLSNSRTRPHRTPRSLEYKRPGSCTACTKRRVFPPGIGGGGVRLNIP